MNARLNVFNVCPTFVQQTFNGCWANVGRTECSSTASTPCNIFKNKGNVEAILNENLNQFKFDSTHFQQAFKIFLRFQ